MCGEHPNHDVLAKLVIVNQVSVDLDQSQVPWRGSLPKPDAIIWMRRLFEVGIGEDNKGVVVKLGQTCIDHFVGVSVRRRHEVALS